MSVSERQLFISKWEREFQTTVKVLKAYPEGKADLQPHAKCPNAKDLAFKMAMEETLFVNGAITGQFDFMSKHEPPATLGALIAKFEQDHRANVAKVQAMSDADFDKQVNFFVAPKTPGLVRSGDTLWLMLNDTIHHRGQFSIYLRLADGKVPSIYGPTADEPWM